MARYEFKLPDIGEGVSEGEIVGWLVRPGDVVVEDQPLVEIMTDKATVTITAPKAGVVIETNGLVGETIPVHAVLVVFELSPPAPRAPEAPRANGASAHPPQAGPSPVGVGELQETSGIKVASPPGTEAYFNNKPLATPHTRKFARDVNVDLRRVPPSGDNGRVTKTDVACFVGSSDTETTSTSPGPVLVQDPVATSSANSNSTARGMATPGLEERVPLAGLRRRIAQKMARSKASAAHFTFVEECDVSELKSLRARLKEAAHGHGVKLTFLPFIVKAVVAALKKHPMLNTALDEATQEIVFRKYYNIGIAAATEAGLLVPVLRHADTLSILEIARELERLGEDARAGKAKHEDLLGSTFTITSLGAKSGLMATPIINFPEVAILGVHQMKRKPVVKGGQIVIGDVMLLSLSFDHRIVDGHVGAAFAYDVIAILEQPERLLLEMA